MALKSYPLFLPLVGVSFLIFVSSRTLLIDALLTPNTNPHLDGSSEECNQDIKRKEADCSNKGHHAVPQNLPKDIERLVLSQNEISSLLNSSFQRYTLIIDLNLSNNDIRFIEPGAFYPLWDLRKLDMSFNYHLVLPDVGLFRWAANLTELDLNKANLKYLPNDTLRWSPLLNYISLMSNKISFINISFCGKIQRIALTANQIEHLNADNFVFPCDTSILDLGGNPITSVDPDVIASLHVRRLEIGNYPLTIEVLRNLSIGISYSEIEELVLPSANLTVLPKDMFDPLRDSSLYVLKLIVNFVKDLYPYVFSNLTKVRELNLYHNLIEVIDPIFFEGMRNLKVLNLEENKIGSLNVDGNTSQVDINELYLYGNFLTEISPSTFLGLEHLTHLNLRSNERLDVLKLTAFTGLHNLRDIDLSECRLTEMILDIPMLKYFSLAKMLSPAYLTPGESFNHTRSLRTLNMAESGLYLVNMWDRLADVSLFDGLLNLETLDLSGNHFDSLWGDLHPGIFRELSALEELVLESCEISFIHPLLFAGLESLQELNLKGNEIQHLHYNVLEGLGKVTTINLDKNLLAHLEDKLFSNNAKLTYLSLAKNRFTHLNYSTFKPIEYSLTSLDLSMNPIVCNCDLKWLPEWLHGQIQLIDEENSTICSSSSLVPAREKPLLDFDPTELCTLNIVGFTMIPLVVVTLLVIIVLVYHNRWLLKYKLFLLKLAAIGYQEIQDARDHNDYEFDLNIIFYDDDEEWIREHLRPALAERLPQFQRNVFGDEDLVLGMHYLDSVDYVVTHSYKTMILLSRAAVRDRWFMLKLRIAMDHVSDTQTEFVVVVFREDIPDDEIPFLARLYLSDGRPYLHWTDDVRGQDYFWAELAKNLTINLRTNDLIPNE